MPSLRATGTPAAVRSLRTAFFWLYQRQSTLSSKPHSVGLFGSLAVVITFPRHVIRTS
jgi:hypothetical protein